MEAAFRFDWDSVLMFTVCCGQRSNKGRATSSQMRFRDLGTHPGRPLCYTNNGFCTFRQYGKFIPSCNETVSVYRLMGNPIVSRSCLSESK
ncbi:hypothetical protein CEXT_19251 [Caerostris extrusa]|uniref:Uncharacterized protein n=1 Tax=Caerostris extrusa TaxID=172846 RepID=A0AAV4XCR3_CAEEX|nr:hypothetical protein CEXT_19251 [Caerostris extrusa]